MFNSLTTFKISTNCELSFSVIMTNSNGFILGSLCEISAEDPEIIHFFVQDSYVSPRKLR